MTKEMKKKLKDTKRWCNYIAYDYVDLQTQAKLPPEGIGTFPIKEEFHFYVTSGIENIAAALGTIIHFEMRDAYWNKSVYYNADEHSKVAFRQLCKYSEVMNR